MSPGATRAWRRVHTWTSLVCTLFLLMLCITGLAMIWLPEIDAHYADHPPVPTPPAGAPRLADLDRVFRDAETRAPGEKITYADWAFTGDLLGVNLAKPGAPRARRQLVYDAHTGVFLEDLHGRKRGHPVRLFLGVMNKLHIQMFAGLPGEFFLAAMTSVFLVALISGVVLYAPFSPKAGFGEVRTERGARIRWLDLHNLLGVATAGWVLVVAATGVMNAFTVPAYAAWRKGVLPELVKPYYGEAARRMLVGATAATAAAEGATPGARMVRITTPGARDGTPGHWVVWTQGDRPVTKKLFRPVLVDAETGAAVVSHGPPWWLSTLQLSRPLHFGDYGGAPLKVLWTLFDLVAIVVLGSGLYLWVARLGRSRRMESHVG